MVGVFGLLGTENWLGELKFVRDPTLLLDLKDLDEEENIVGENLAKALPRTSMQGEDMGKII